MNALRLLLLVLFAGISVVSGAGRRQSAPHPARRPGGVVWNGHAMKPCPCPCPDLCHEGESTTPEVVYPPIPLGANASYRSHLGNVCSFGTATSDVNNNTDSGGWEIGSKHRLRVYAFRTINGTRYYSDTYYQTAEITYDIGARYWTFSGAPSLVEGFRVLHFTDDGVHPMNYDYYRDIAVTESIDDFIYSQWTAGSTVTPNTITPGAADLSELYLLRWEDQTGNLKHLLQATFGFRPLHAPLQISGFPAARCDGVDDKMQIAATFAAQNDFTMIMALRCQAISRGLVSLGGLTYNYRTTTQFGLRSNTGSIFSIPNPPTDPTTTCIISVSRFGAVGTLRVNGVQRNTGAIGSATWNNIGILIDAISNSGSIVDWAALDIWNSNLTLPQKIATEQQFAAAYVTIPTPYPLENKITLGGDSSEPWLWTTGDSAELKWDHTS